MASRRPYIHLRLAHGPGRDFRIGCDEPQAHLCERSIRARTVRPALAWRRWRLACGLFAPPYDGLVKALGEDTLAATPARTSPEGEPPRGAPSSDERVRASATAGDGSYAPVVLFDGVCNLCDRTIQFIVDHERSASLRFASLQSDVAHDLIEKAFGSDEAERLLGGMGEGRGPESVVLVDGERGYTHSTAALRIAGHLRAPYRWLVAFAIVPRPIRDVVYRWIARNRYRWFGKSETCRVPTPELRARFLA